MGLGHRAGRGAGAGARPHAPAPLPARTLPLFTVFGTAMSVVDYCSYRALALNPDVQ